MVNAKSHQDDYNKKIDKINKQIEELKGQLNVVDKKINGLPKFSSTRREELQKRLAELRDKQGELKREKQALFTELDAIDLSIKKKVGDIKSLQTKAQCKTPADVDDRVRELEQRIESGVRLVEEKKILQEISALKRSRNEIGNVGTYQSQVDSERERQQEIKSKKAAIETKAKDYSDEYEKLDAELKKLRDKQDDHYSQRRKLFDEKSGIKTGLDEQYDALRALRESQRNAFEERKKDQARQKVLKDAESRLDRAKQDLEFASQPAFEQEIILCENLSNYLRRFSSNTSDKPSPSSAETDENLAQEDAVSNKTDDSANSSSIVLSKGKKSRQKKSGSLTIPISTLDNFLEIRVPVPTKVADIDETLKQLAQKKTEYTEKQPEETEARKKKAEEKILEAQEKYDALKAKLDEENDLLKNASKAQAAE